MSKMNRFDPVAVPLEGINLIEASAGTGKTYSIAILVLRLLLEKSLSIKEILMVTFTKAAVAELEDRIRRFIRLANGAANGLEIADKTIEQLVISSIQQTSADEVTGKLKEAVLFLDEIQVLTIHGFCQQTLNEFALETNQLFGADVVPDITPVLEDEVNKFWRTNVTTIPATVLSELFECGLSREGIRNVVVQQLAGKRYIKYVPGEGPHDLNLLVEAYSHLIGGLREVCSEKYQEVVAYISDQADVLKNAISKNNFAKKKGLDQLVDYPDQLIKEICGAKVPNYINEIFAGVLSKLDEYNASEDQCRNATATLIDQIACNAIDEVTAGIDTYKALHNIQTYADLITNLHKAMKSANGASIAKKLRAKYKALFIDEFQDTDRVQYEIFQSAFNQDTISFYIGDPKQLIYAWRSADIYTYFTAREDADVQYTMNANYRSTAPYIEAMNLFFMLETNFDVFHFDGNTDTIAYHPVEFPDGKEIGSIAYSGKNLAPISIVSLPNIPVIAKTVAFDIYNLLADKKHTITINGLERSISPADIGILVRSTKQGQLIKNELAQIGIPSVTVNEKTVFASEESRYLLYLMEAIFLVTRSAINKVLLSPLTGFTIPDLLRLDDETTIELFRKYRRTWEMSGIYVALKAFVNDFNVKENLLARIEKNGERMLTNVFQLIELLHRKQSRAEMSELELISWLKRGIEGMATEGDEFLQRVESDEESVKIVTIHKSKGLEYNIVFAPFLDFQSESRSEDRSFRDSSSGDYIYAKVSQLSEDAVLECAKQTEQENRRLLYVTLTRAVFRCFIYQNSHYQLSTLTTFLNTEKARDVHFIEFRDAPILVEGLKYSVPVTNENKTNGRFVNFHLSQPNWRRMSYTMLRAEHENAPKLKSYSGADVYDQFVFTRLLRGAHTGNMLHYLLENTHFSDTSFWEQTVLRAVDRFASNQKESYQTGLRTMLDHILNVKLQSNSKPFELSRIASNRRIHELEFDFPVTPFQTAELTKLSGPGFDISIKDFQELEGMMNGKIDLFFEQDGQYYVLDWKTNFLGSALSDYSTENLMTAMNENNYHLQYLIYTVAVKKYLESRIPDIDFEKQFGGVYYLFVRGIRKNESTGIFYAKPSLKLIQETEKILSGTVEQN